MVLASHLNVLLTALISYLIIDGIFIIPHQLILKSSSKSEADGLLNLEQRNPMNIIPFT